MEEEEEDAFGAELATAPSPNNYEMIEKLGYLISLSRSAAPLAKEPLLKIKNFPPPPPPPHT